MHIVVCVYIHAHTQSLTHIDTRTFTDIYAYICAYIYNDIHAYIQTNICLFVCVCVCKWRAGVNIYIFTNSRGCHPHQDAMYYTHVWICIWLHTHARTHAHTNTSSIQMDAGDRDQQWDIDEVTCEGMGKFICMYVRVNIFMGVCERERESVEWNIDVVTCEGMGKCTCMYVCANLFVCVCERAKECWVEYRRGYMRGDG